MPESARELMATLADDVVVREQYLHFFKNRMFRQTLLCHAEAPVRRDLDDACLAWLAVSSSAAPEGGGAAGAGRTRRPRRPRTSQMTTSEPHVRAPMHALAAALRRIAAAGLLRA